MTRGSPLQQLEDIIVSQYPRVSLAMTGFTFARADKGRRLSHFEGSTVDDLETCVGKGKVIILPKRDLAIPALIPALPEQVTNTEIFTLPFKTSVY